MRVGLSLLVVFSFVVMVTTAAFAGNRAYVVDPGLIATTISGPRTLIITGNPFRYPWQLAVNQQTVSGTGLSTLPTQFTQPFTGPTAAPGAGGATPTPNTISSPVNGAGAIVIGLISASQLKGPAATSNCDLTKFSALAKCIDQLQTSVNSRIATDVASAYDSVRKAQVEFIALQQRTDIVLAEQRENLSQASTRLAARHAIGCLIGLAPTNPLPPPPVMPCDPNDASVNSVNAKIAQISAYPNADFANDKSTLDQLRGALKYAKDKQNGATQDEIDRRSKQLDTVDVILQQYLSGSNFAKNYDAAVSQLTTLRSTVLSNVAPSRFYAVVDENCTGVYGGGRSTVVTVTRYDNVANSVTVSCPIRSFVSQGFAFSGLPQHDFSAVATNAALPSAPSGSATPAPATIVESNSSDVRPMPVVFLNVRLTADEKGDNGWYATFGLSVNSSPQNVTIDYLGGVSYALSRSLIGTLGVTLAPTTALAPGFHVGDPAVDANSRPPTITRYKTALFLAVSYGAH